MLSVEGGPVRKIRKKSKGMFYGGSPKHQRKLF